MMLRPVRSLVLAVVFAAVAAGGLACGGSGGGGVSISGTVAGSAGVTVTLPGAATATATTDASGRYAFRGSCRTRTSSSTGST